MGEKVQGLERGIYTKAWNMEISIWLEQSGGTDAVQTRQNVRSWRAKSLCKPCKFWLYPEGYDKPLGLCFVLKTMKETSWDLHFQKPVSCSVWKMTQSKTMGDDDKLVHKCLYSTITHNNQNAETTQMSVNKWMDKQIMVYTCNRIFGHKKWMKYWYTLQPGSILKIC